MSETAERAIDNRVDTLLVAAHGIAALIALLIAALFGIIISLQFFLPDLTGSVLPLGWGRLRYAHTQGIMFGWLGNVFLAFLYHAVPVLTGCSTIVVVDGVRYYVCNSIYYRPYIDNGVTIYVIKE